jgi:nucleoside-diphosphate-sugar epimerase
MIDDYTIQRPITMYGFTKVFGELLGRFYARKFDLDFRGVRLPSVVGPGAKTAHMSIYNAWAIEEPLRGHSYELRCQPETKCPVIYFKDAVRALWLLAQAQRSQIPTMIYNLAGISPPFSARELVATVRARIPEARLTLNPTRKWWSFWGKSADLKLMIGVLSPSGVGISVIASRKWLTILSENLLRTTHGMYDKNFHGWRVLQWVREL